MKYLETAHETDTNKWADERGIERIKNKKRGWPDQLYLVWPPLFIEFKKEGEEPDEYQKEIHKRIRAWGFDVEVHESAKTAIASLLPRARLARSRATIMATKTLQQKSRQVAVGTQKRRVAARPRTRKNV
jgi:hypothetical protein